MGFEDKDIRGKKILITSIQRFSLHDGPGIRTTFFLKGCSVCCPWCCNPENICLEIQTYKKEGIYGKYGEWYTPNELYDEAMKDSVFYEQCGDDGRGGVTFSGGECMLQMDAMVPMLQKLKKENIHMVAETSLFCSNRQLSIAVTYIDLFYVDIKVMDGDKCRKMLGGRIDTYKDNLKMLLDSEKPFIFRIPVIGGYTDDAENRRHIVNLLKECTKAYENVKGIEIIKEHNLGLSKYQSLIEGGNEVTIPRYKGVDDSLIECYKDEIEKQLCGAVPVKILRI